MVSKYDEGVASAQIAIADGRLQLFSGAPSKSRWGIDLAETLRARFGVEVIFVSDMTDQDRRAYEGGYNATVEEHIDRGFGEGLLAAALAEVQLRRKQRYDEYFAKKATNVEDPHSSGPTSELRSSSDVD